MFFFRLYKLAIYLAIFFFFLFSCCFDRDVRLLLYMYNTTDIGPETKASIAATMSPYIALNYCQTQNILLLLLLF